jgi:hypothetical protein
MTRRRRTVPGCAHERTVYGTSSSGGETGDETRHDRTQRGRQDALSHPWHSLLVRLPQTGRAVASAIYAAARWAPKHPHALLRVGAWCARLPRLARALRQVLRTQEHSWLEQVASGRRIGLCP